VMIGDLSDPGKLEGLLKSATSPNWWCSPPQCAFSLPAGPCTVASRERSRARRL